MSAEALPRPFGSYVLLEKIAEGGAGAIYLAKPRDPASPLGTPLVIKCLREQLADDEEQTARFRHEALIAVSVDTPHVVRVFDVGAVGKVLYLAMEHLRGWSVSRVLDAFGRASFKPSLATALAFACDGLRGLDALHRAAYPVSGAPLEVVHRDLSPRNLMITPEGRLVLIDLGLGRSNARDWKTRAGAVMGTPGYMSPEQVLAQPVDQRSDLYTFALVFWEMLTVDRYFPRADLATMIAAMRAPKLRLPSAMRKDIPADLDLFFTRALSPKREERYASAREMLDVLEPMLARAGAVEGIELPSSLQGELATRDREIKALLERGRSEEGTEEATVLFAQRRTAENTSRERSMSWIPSTSDAPESSFSESSRTEHRFRPQIIDVRIEIDPPAHSRAQKIALIITPIALAVLGVAIAPLWMSPSTTTRAVLPPKTPVESPARTQPRARAIERAPLEDEPRPAEQPEPVSPRKAEKPRVRVVAETAEVSEAPEPAVDPSVRLAALIDRAAAMSRAHPERAKALDEIITDASIWLRSNDRERAAGAIGELEARLRAVGE